MILSMKADGEHKNEQMVQVMGDAGEIMRDLHSLGSSFNIKAEEFKAPLIVAFLAGIKARREDLETAKRILNDLGIFDGKTDFVDKYEDLTDELLEKILS